MVTPGSAPLPFLQRTTTVIASEVSRRRRSMISLTTKLTETVNVASGLDD